MFCLYLLLWHGTPILLRKGYNRLSIKNNNAVTMSSRTWVGLWFSSKTPSLPPSLLSCFHWGHTNLEVLSSMDLNNIYGITEKTHICKTTIFWRVSRCGMASGGLCNVKLIGVQQRAISEYKTVAELPCPASLMTFALSHFPSSSVYSSVQYSAVTVLFPILVPSIYSCAVMNTTLVFFFIFLFCHSILCPPSVPSRKCIVVFSLNFFSLSAGALCCSNPLSANCCANIQPLPSGHMLMDGQPRMRMKLFPSQVN